MTARTIAIMIAALGGAVFGIAGADVASAQTPTNASKSALTARAQAQPPSTRPRTRIRVTPGYYPYRTFSTTYPVPYRAEYPGPGFVRECTSWLAPEARASGPVIVPRMRCWWQPGISDLKSYP